MKKLVMIAVLAALAASAVFAGGGKDSGAAKKPAGDKQITVRLLTDATGIDDKSFNAAAWRGILSFYGDTWANPKQRGTAYDVVTAQTQDMYIPNLLQATDEGYDLICATGFTFADAMTQVAGDHPDQKYMIVDVDWVGLPNVLQAVYAEHEGSFLVGAAAALKAKADGAAPKFGFIGGIPGATITKFEVGYIQGILAVSPDAQIVDYYVNSWGEPGLAKTQAKSWYDSGVYAIYSAAGGSGNGTIAQAKEYRMAGKNVWAIGVDSDQFEEGLLPNSKESAVLTSMLKMVETSLVYGLNAVKNNTFRGEVITFDMKANGVGYSAANTALTADIKKQLEDYKAKIIDGRIKVAAKYADAKKLPGFPKDLKALDD